MKKVKLTKEQADALKLSIADYGTDNVMDYHDSDNWVGRLEPLNDLPHSELARALYVGYEVIEEYKPGDWVLNEDGVHVGKITLVEKDDHYDNYYGYWYDIEHGTRHDMPKVYNVLFIQNTPRKNLMANSMYLLEC
jgi:hypothetical protein